MENQKGLFDKYQVRDIDGNPLDSGTFVLRPFNQDGTVKDHCAVSALWHYADFCESEGESELANGLRLWLGNPVESETTKTLNVPN